MQQLLGALRDLAFHEAVFYEDDDACISAYDLTQAFLLVYAAG